VSDDVDLNLLRVFDALMQTGSVTGAAEHLHLSPSATSRALTRLRRAMGDEIMVRAGQGLVATPFARSSAARIRRILEDVGQLAAAGQGMNPENWQRTFTVRINDALVPVLTPPILASTQAETPGVVVRFVGEDAESVDDLRDGTIDIDVGTGGPDSPDIRSRPILEDRYVAVVAVCSELGEVATITVDHLCRYPHISASRRGRARGPIDDELQRLNRTRRVAAVVPSLASAAILALERDVIVPMPALLANHLVDRGLPLRVHQLPLDVPPLHIAQRWHRRLDTDQPTIWLLQRIHDSITAAVLTRGSRSNGDIVDT
jgi:DNA-binding transcriptional LysR family regulator